MGRIPMHATGNGRHRMAERNPTGRVPAIRDGLTVQETAERTGLSEHNLRYYERAGLLDPVRRHDSSGHRRYSTADISRIATLACLRATGLPLDQMRRYFTLSAKGRTAAAELRALLEEQQEVLQDRLEQMQHHLRYVKRKIQYWRAIEARDDQAAADIADELTCQVLGTTSHSTGAETARRSTARRMPTRS